MSNIEFQALGLAGWKDAFGKVGTFALVNDITEPDATFSYIFEIGFTFLPQNVFPCSVQGISHHPGTQGQDPESL